MMFITHIFVQNKRINVFLHDLVIINFLLCFLVVLCLLELAVEYYENQIRTEFTLQNKANSTNKKGKKFYQQGQEF